MIVRHRFALSFIAASVSVASAGCAVDASSDEGGDDEAHEGDGVASEDDLVSERQLSGSELPSKTLSLTFDDGPGRRTAELATYLADKGVKGTFFINGSKVPGRQGAIDAIVGRGHLLANHTQNHKQLTSLSARSIVKEIAETDAILTAVQPEGPWMIRAPFGAWNAGVARAINATAMKKYIGSVFWDEGGVLTANAAADWDCWGKGLDVQRCGDLYLKEIRAKKRGIVLMHDVHDKTVEMVTYILPTLIAEGFTFTALEEVPSVKRAILSAPASDDQCQSATLGRPVDANVCVQSRSTRRWSRCVDGEWLSSTGPSDTKCIRRYPL